MLIVERRNPRDPKDFIIPQYSRARRIYAWIRTRVVCTCKCRDSVDAGVLVNVIDIGASDVSLAPDFAQVKN